MLHGTVRTKKVVANTFSGFQPLSEIENSKISQLKNFMEDTTGGDLLFRILINNLKSYEKENSLMENHLDWEATNMNGFFLKEYQLPEPWILVRFSYINVILSLLIEGLANYQYRKDNKGKERRKKNTQFLHDLELEEFYNNLNSNGYILMERYHYSLMQFLYPIESKTFIGEILGALRQYYWPKAFHSKWKNEVLPHINEENLFNASINNIIEENNSDLNENPEGIEKKPKGNVNTL
jgi:hypothetical protein